MCIFTNDKDIPAYVRLSTRTLQYLIIPLLSLAILTVGARHLYDCPGQPHLPIWHIVAGCSGILVPVLYLLFDKLNPALASHYPLLSEFLDNAIVLVIPVYILFEVAWLITGTVWLVTINKEDQLQVCDDTIYIFSMVVIINFWIHLLTPLAFMLSVCCSRIFPFIGYFTYWKIIKNAVDLWTFQIRFFISVLVSVPLSCAMIAVGVNGVTACKPVHQYNETVEVIGKENLETTEGISSSAGDIPTATEEVSTVSGGISSTESHQRYLQSMPDVGYLNLPGWLIIAGTILFLLPLLYTLYDKFCKLESNNSTGCGLVCRVLVVFYLLFAMAWAIIGFLWIFGTQTQGACNMDSNTYKFAFGSLICLNILMDVWICVKISIVLYWSILSDDT